MDIKTNSRITVFLKTGAKVTGTFQFFNKTELCIENDIKEKIYIFMPHDNIVLVKEEKTEEDIKEEQSEVQQKIVEEVRSNRDSLDVQTISELQKLKVLQEKEIIKQRLRNNKITHMGPTKYGYPHSFLKKQGS
jgi:sRNA-binding regulator protein Hfq